MSRELETLSASLAREAGALLRDFAGRPGAVDTKSSATDPVTEADRATERFLRGRLADLRPNDAILGEEGDDFVPDSPSGLRWVVDPIDGTVNFLYGIPIFCVSVAVEDDQGTVAGAIYDPSRDECFCTSRGGASRCSPRAATLDRALIATGFAYDRATRSRQAAVISELLPRARDIRRGGSAALDLAWTAAGRYDAYFERGVKHWDIAAGRLLCTNAGLEVRELPAVDGLPFGLVAAPASFVDELLDLVT